MATDIHGNYVYSWDLKIEHVLRIDPSINIAFLPVEMQMKMLANKVVCTPIILLEHLEYIQRNCSKPFHIQSDDTILFSDEDDRIMFLTTQG